VDRAWRCRGTQLMFRRGLTACGQSAMVALAVVEIMIYVAVECFCPREAMGPHR